MSFQNEREVERYSLLIIDDEVEITKALTRQFRKKYNVYSATSVFDGLNIMEKEHIQVILSDQRMPDMTGVDFFTLIKDKYPDALKLLITGYSDIEAVIGAINEGQVFRYITKPWNPDELESIVKEACEKYELITNNRKLLKSLKEINIDLENKVQDRTAELQKLNNHLTELNKEKNRYIGMVAHDLRNPIGTAEAFSELILDNYETLEKADELEYLGLINQSCSFSLNLIHEFLDVAKIEAGIFDLNLSKSDYVAFLKKNLTQNELFAKRKSQEICLYTNLSELIFNFDKNKIEQVMNNLLSNAIKYSLPGSKTIVNVSVENNTVITQIIDMGQGIPQNELSKLFNAFQTTSTKPTDNEKSTGLGLSIVKKIIESHHGSLIVESEVGKGSVFTFKLPII